MIASRPPTAISHHQTHRRSSMSWPNAWFRTRPSTVAAEPRHGGSGAGWALVSRWAGWLCVSATGRRMAESKSMPAPESVGEAEDIWDGDSVKEGGLFPDHLIVMVNGLGGSAEDWRFAAEQFVKKLPNEVIVHRSECNSLKLTFDGVDLMGERLAEEVRSVVERRRGVKRISFIAHSLGGLIARYALGRLYEPKIYEESAIVAEYRSGKDGHLEGRIAGLEPVNFITLATPHLGSQGNKQLPFLCGLPFLEQRASETAHLIVGRTGKHLFLTDGDNGEHPLLLRMVDDCDDIKFISALHSFKRRVVYANANYDHMVGWRTSSIRRQHELPKHNLLVEDAKYPHIVHFDERSNAYVNASSSDTNVQTSDLEEKMIRGLTQLPWERVDVSFQNSRQRYVAHNTIQVKSYWLNSDGADVIFHMIDNFLI